VNGKRGGTERTSRAAARRRPTRREAALLPERILDVATELFLPGLGATSIAAVAARARISNRPLPPSTTRQRVPGRVRA